MKLILKIMILLGGLAPLCSRVAGQQYQLREGHIRFSIIAPASELTADNDSLSGSLDLGKGTLRITAYVAGFAFTSAEMPELMRKGATYRFHHYYFDSERYPLATFNGAAAALKKIDPAKDGTYEISCEGKLSMHDVIKIITVKGTVTMKSGIATLNSDFMIDPHDYAVRIPETISRFYYKDMKIAVKARMVRKGAKQ
ncbi:YceI family protein [Taibaiella helva]|uniref:YceI family protein n=1 Tax=Taibaiella helva TaxID=2301235 RepID=UPI000E56813C|nr:YceI family protein [Taibaiella helva]